MTVVITPKINYLKLEWLYRNNGWHYINGRWHDCDGNGFTQTSLDQAQRLFGDDYIAGTNGKNGGAK